MERADFLERVPGGDGVDEQESFACAHVLFPHGAVSQETSYQRPFQERQTGVSCGETQTDSFPLTRTLPDQRCQEHQEGLLHHQSHTASGMNLFPSGTSLKSSRPQENLGNGGAPSIVGSYSSTKWLWMNWMVKADLPTPAPAHAICQTTSQPLAFS